MERSHVVCDRAWHGEAMVRENRDRNRDLTGGHSRRAAREMQGPVFTFLVESRILAVGAARLATERRVFFRTPASSTGLWRLPLSMAVNTRDGRLSARGSCTKSMLQRSVGPVGIRAGPRCNAMGLRRRTRIRSGKPSSRSSRRTRFRFTRQPSRRRSTQMRRDPNRGRAWARSRMRSRRPD